MTLGEKIRCARRAKGFSQSELADGLCSRSCISELERNKRNPSVESLKLLANRLGKPISFFVTDQRTLSTLQVKCLLAQANGYIYAGKVVQAEEALNEASPLINAANDSLKAKYYKLLLYMSIEESNLRLAVEHAILADCSFSKLNGPDQQWECLYCAAVAHSLAGSYDMALRLALRALNLVSTGTRYIKLHQLTLYQLRNICVAKGENYRAEGFLREAKAVGKCAINTSILCYLTESMHSSEISDRKTALAWAEAAEDLVEKDRYRGLCTAARPDN